MSEILESRGGEGGGGNWKVVSAKSNREFVPDNLHFSQNFFGLLWDFSMGEEAMIA